VTVRRQVSGTKERGTERSAVPREKNALRTLRFNPFFNRKVRKGRKDSRSPLERVPNWSGLAAIIPAQAGICENLCNLWIKFCSFFKRVDGLPAWEKRGTAALDGK